MIKFEKLQIEGWEPAIRGMRNAKNSWEKSDSIFVEDGEYHDINGNQGPYYGIHEEERSCIELGPNDHKLMMNLRNAGSDHRKYLRQIIVWVDIIAPLYWWKEFDTYKVGTVANSCSTMHTIHEKEFTLEDFSCEKLIDDHDMCYKQGIMLEMGGYITFTPLDILRNTIYAMNHYREKFLETKDKIYWEQMIQLLPTSYNQRRTIMFSYENLANMFHSREFHKLDEWRTMCAWMKTLPYPELITGKVETNDENESI